MTLPRRSSTFRDNHTDPQSFRQHSTEWDGSSRLQLLRGFPFPHGYPRASSPGRRRMNAAAPASLSSISPKESRHPCPGRAVFGPGDITDRESVVRFQVEPTALESVSPGLQPGALPSELRLHVVFSVLFALPCTAFATGQLLVRSQQKNPMSVTPGYAYSHEMMTRRHKRRGLGYVFPERSANRSAPFCLLMSPDTKAIIVSISGFSVTVFVLLKQRVS